MPSLRRNYNWMHPRPSLVIKEQPITQENVIAFDLALYQACRAEHLQWILQTWLHMKS